MSSNPSFDQAILDHAFKGATYTQPANLYVALYSDLTATTELSGNGYARVEVTFAAANANIKASNANVVFSASGDWNTALSMAIVDDSTAGNVLVYKGLTPSRSLKSGDTLTFESGNIKISLD